MFQVIGALTSVLMIWVVTGVLLYLAVGRVINENFELDAGIMLITSAVGVAVNLVLVITQCCWVFFVGYNLLPISILLCRMGLTLHQHGHSHGGEGHGHSHGHNHEKSGDANNTLNKTNINVRAAYIHVLGDFIQSTGVLVAALIIYFQVSPRVQITKFINWQNVELITNKKLARNYNFVPFLSMFCKLSCITFWLAWIDR